MPDQNTFEWICEWFSSNCNRDWEHDFGLTIETIDNPGWSITIDTAETSTILPDKQWILIEVNELDWYGYKISNGRFEASGDPKKLQLLLNLFRKDLDSIISHKQD